MADKPKPQQGTPPELPPVDPVELERALRRAVLTPKPPGGWNKGAKKKPAGGADGG